MQTSTHQDHVIAHVIGAELLGYFILDEAAHFILDMNFIWTIHLDAQVALLPTGVAVDEFALPREQATQLRQEIDALRSGGHEVKTINVFSSAGAIESVSVFENNHGVKLVISTTDQAVEVISSFPERTITVDQP
jgi:hypothetical protein